MGREDTLCLCQPRPHPAALRTPGCIFQVHHHISRHPEIDYLSENINRRRLRSRRGVQRDPHQGRRNYQSSYFLMVSTRTKRSTKRNGGLQGVPEPRPVALPRGGGGGGWADGGGDGVFLDPRGPKSLILLSPHTLLSLPQLS